VAGWALVAPDGSEHVREVVTPFLIASRPIRPISPGWPMSAVRIGPHDDLSARESDIIAEFRAWGVLGRLLPCGAGSPTLPEE
jgi:hypothetical protein